MAKKEKKLPQANGAGEAGKGGAGSDGSFKPRTYKISKLSIWPTRKINLGNYNTVDVSSGVEVTFDNPVDFDSPEVKRAHEDMRKVVGEEMKAQYEAFKPKKKPAEAKPEAGK